MWTVQRGAAFWKKICCPIYFPVGFKWGVIRGAQEFAKEVGASLHTSFAPDCNAFTAWYLVKPPAHAPVRQGAEAKAMVRTR